MHNHSKEDRTFARLVQIEKLIKQYKGQKQQEPHLSQQLKSGDIEMIVSEAQKIFLSQNSVIEIGSPVLIVGDVEGSLQNLLEIFSQNKFPDQQNYLFLGNYTSQNPQSMECLLLLLIYKILYPENFFLVRGPYDSQQNLMKNGFYISCKPCLFSFSGLFLALEFLPPPPANYEGGTLRLLAEGRWTFHSKGAYNLVERGVNLLLSLLIFSARDQKPIIKYTIVFFWGGWGCYFVPNKLIGMQIFWWLLAAQSIKIL